MTNSAGTLPVAGAASAAPGLVVIARDVRQDLEVVAGVEDVRQELADGCFSWRSASQRARSASGSPG